MDSEHGIDPSSQSSAVEIEEKKMPQEQWKTTNEDIPNGGLQAWLQVLGAWVLFFNTWGLINCFGEYETYYLDGQIFTASSSNISWIGSIQSFLLLFVGLITGPLYDAGYLRALLITGSFMVVFGHMMLSLVGSYWQALLAQAFVVGIGAGCLFVPSVAVISTYFSTKVSTAIGIAASGSSVGGIIYPIMLHRLVPEIGFPWAVRTIGFMALGLLIIPCAVMQMRVKPSKKRKLVDFSAFKELPFTLFIFGGLIGFAGLIIAFYYVSYYAISIRATSVNLGFYLIPILNAASIFGRIIPNIIADKIGPLNVFIPSAAMAGILALCLIPAKNAGGIIAICVLYGFFSGSFVSIPPSVIVSLTPPQKRGSLGTRVGMGFCIIALGLLMGPPIAGAILGEGRDANFTGTWIFGGCMILAATVVFLAARIAHRGVKLLAKC